MDNKQEKSYQHHHSNIKRCSVCGKDTDVDCMATELAHYSK